MVLVITAEMAKEYLVNKLKLEINEKVLTKIQSKIFQLMNQNMSDLFLEIKISYDELGIIPNSNNYEITKIEQLLKLMGYKIQNNYSKSYFILSLV